MVGSIDKTVAIDTGIDSPTWARIKQGEAGIKGEFLDRLMDACGNELPLLWLLHSRGYDPRSIEKYESELERQVRESDARAEKAEMERDMLIRLFQGKAAASTPSPISPTSTVAATSQPGRKSEKPRVG